MITSRSVEEFVEWAKTYLPDPKPDAKNGYTDAHLCGFIAQYGFFLGYVIEPPKKLPQGLLKFSLTVDLQDQPAYIVVKSGREDQTHAILWDGNKVLDPWPYNNNLPLNCYEVTRILPIYKWVTE